jgi:hypothetical protein
VPRVGLPEPRQTAIGRWLVFIRNSLDGTSKHWSLVDRPRRLIPAVYFLDDAVRLGGPDEGFGVGVVLLKTDFTDATGHLLLEIRKEQGVLWLVVEKRA